jgi:hypothetical protein
MRECQRGWSRQTTAATGSFCKARDLCRSEGRCYFVARVERYRELHGGMPGEHGIRWIHGFDEPDLPWFDQPMVA